jgi:sugar O-acyltransferase (sialic acid O-acetyltransferase NeuD family)
MSKVVIFGNKDFSQLAHFYLTKDSPHDVVGFTMNKKFIEDRSFHDLPMVPFEDLEEHYSPEEFKLFIPMSYAALNEHRKAKYLEAKNRGYQFVSYISSKATYFDTKVGENCFIFEDNTIQPFTSIGNNCVIWSGNHIGHHSIIEDHVFLASHIVVSGHCIVGESSFVGVNATINNNIRIGKRNIISSGALIKRDTPDEAVYKAKQAELSERKSYEVKI